VGARAVGPGGRSPQGCSAASGWRDSARERCVARSIGAQRWALVVIVSDALRNLVNRYGIRSIDDQPYGAQPLERDDGEEETAERLANLAWEQPADSWRSVTVGGTATRPPHRFIDGSVNGRTVAVLTVEGGLRPALLAVVGAMALELNGRDLHRCGDTVRTDSVFCVFSNQIPATDLDALQAALDRLGMTLVAPTTTDPAADFEVLRRRTWDLAKRCMEDAEREVLVKDPTTPCLLDGLLERRVTTVASQAIPAFGMVKRQLNPLLPQRLANLIHRLAPGERTPAFVVDTEHASIVTWYLRLSDPRRAAPTAGIVRVSATRAYLETAFPDPATRTGEISAVSAWLRSLRCRQASYRRADVSLEPIVRLEDQLHALLPPLSQLTARLHRAFGD
jgi:hypothetical protein